MISKTTELIHWQNDESAVVNRTGQVLSELIRSSSQLDVLTGYFYFNGVPEIEQALAEKGRLRKEFKLRILIGMEAEVGVKDCALTLHECNQSGLLTEAERKERYAWTLREIFKRMSDRDKTNADAALFNRYVEMLAGGDLSLEIKQTAKTNHAKLYIFHPEDTAQTKVYVLGSSNFSRPGLAERQELNVQIVHEGADEVAGLYDRLWKEASYTIAEAKPGKRNSEASPDMLNESSPYKRPTPFEAYLALMKRYLGESVLDEKLRMIFEDALGKATLKLKSSGKPFVRLNYQLKGAEDAIRILRVRGGAILADAVGLGKSVTAALIATQAHPGGGVIIVPPTIVDDWREKYVAPFGLDRPGCPWKVFSMTELEEAKVFCDKNPVGMVIVDEAHRFRNAHIAGYETLQLICHSRRVVLLTATPFNNAPSDLASLVNLFPAWPGAHNGESIRSVHDRFVKADTYFNELVFLQRNLNRNVLPRTIKNRFDSLKEKHAALKGREHISAELKRMGDDLLAELRPYLVRRNRADLKADSRYFQDDKPIPMPEQKVEGHYYTLSGRQEDAFHEILDVFQHSADSDSSPDKGFACTIYRVAEYAEADDKVGNYLDNYRSMLLRHLIRRFESSPYAFLRSVEDLIQRHEQALADLQNPDKLYFNPKEKKEKEVNLGETDEDGEDGAEPPSAPCFCRPGSSIRGTPFLPGQDEAFMASLKRDLDVLVRLQEQARTLCQSDSKLALLKERIGPSVLRKAGDTDPFSSPSDHVAPRRVVIFSMFIDTARHLAQELSATFGPGCVMLAMDKLAGADSSLNLQKVTIVHKAKAVETYFDTQSDEGDVWKGPRILITTDKFSEGINLNRAGILVNYDIPWNPVRIIQRLGRINRISDCWFKHIYVYNLYPAYRKEGAKSRVQPEHASPQDIAAQKMILIHQLFFEDATILGDPTAGGEKPFAALDQAGMKDEEKSEDTLIHQRYQAALCQAGYTAERDVKDLEAKLLGFGMGMRTVRLGAPVANMVIFKQSGAFIRAEWLEHLRTTDMNERPKPLRLLKALDEVASAPDAPCFPATDRFPGWYEDIKHRMGTSPAVVKGVVHSLKPPRKTERAVEVLGGWCNRFAREPFGEDLGRLREICDRDRLHEALVAEILKTGVDAGRDRVATVVASAREWLAAPTPAAALPTDLPDSETILTFVNETIEGEANGHTR